VHVFQERHRAWMHCSALSRLTQPVGVLHHTCYLSLQRAPEETPTAWFQLVMYVMHDMLPYVGA
jgi:hypothetical protein